EAGSEIRVACDLVVLATGVDPMASLLGQAGCELRYDATLDRPVPVRLVPGVFAAGEVAGVSGTADLLRDGRRAAAEAARSLETAIPSIRAPGVDGQTSSERTVGVPSPHPSPTGEGATAQTVGAGPS